MVFPVVINGCESWTVKKAEHRRIDAFELWCWRRLLRVPWTARRSNQYILKEISPGCTLEGMMLKLKVQYFGHLMWRVDSLEKTLMLERDWGQEEKRTTEDEMAGWHHRLNGCEFEWTLGVGDGQGGLACCGSWGRKKSDTTEWLNWTELNWVDKKPFSISAFLKNGGHRVRPAFILICRNNTWSFIYSLFEKYFLSSWHMQSTVFYAARNTTNKTNKKPTNYDTLCLSSRGPYKRGN